MPTEQELKAKLEAQSKEVDALLLAVGQAISDWAFVEESLFEIFYTLMAARAYGPPACAFIAAENVRTKIAMVDTMMRHSKRGREVLPEWEKLLKRCNKLRQGRNRVAHQRAITLQLGGSKSQAALVGYRHDIRHHLKDEFAVMSHIKIDQVRRWSAQFRELGGDLVNLAQRIRPASST